MAGWRIGMLGGREDYLATILKVKSNMDSGMFMPMQMAAVEALSNPPSWYNFINKEYSARRIKSFEILDLLECKYDRNQVGMFVWAKIPDKYNKVEELTDTILEEANVFITPGIIFGKNGNRYIRISLCSKVILLDEALNRIKLLINK